MEYKIYHIPGVKIGCSKRVEERVKEQGYTNYEILEVHTDINLVSIREKELQKEYGYEEKFVKTDYKQQYQFGIKGRELAKGKGAKSQIENKIGIWSMSKDERSKIQYKASLIGAKKAKEVLSKAVNVYDYKTNKFLTQFYSLKETARQLNASAGNIRSVINGNRNHTKGYTFQYA